MTKPAEVALLAAALVRTGWTQGTEARDEEGRPVYATDPAAVCWCATGAIRRVASVIGAGLPDYDVILAAANAVATCGMGIVAWNDEPGRTQDDVAAALDAAAARLAALEPRTSKPARQPNLAT